MTKTIRKNAHKKIQSIIETAFILKVYSLSNDFIGIKHTDKDAIKVYLKNVIEKHEPIIRQTNVNEYVFQMNSNWWYEVETEMPMPKSFKKQFDKLCKEDDDDFKKG